jgi:16S rRNA (adenine1518-N6/adenine1519-N6)-dimethyltransferase
VRPTKSRGQNFLTSGAVADRIVAAAELDQADHIIEVGPGLGILTEKIARLPHRSVTLVELDARLAARLADRFAGDLGVRVINADFLALDFASICRSMSPPRFCAASAITRARSRGWC